MFAPASREARGGVAATRRWTSAGDAAPSEGHGEGLRLGAVDAGADRQSIGADRRTLRPSRR